MKSPKNSQENSTGGEGGNTEPLPPAKKNRYDYQYWTITINNYTKDQLQLLPTLPELIKYCYQEEIGENGTKHIQGILCFKNRISLKTLKHRSSNIIHAEAVKSWIECLAYCHKLDTRNGKVITNIPEVLARLTEQNYYYIDPRLEYLDPKDFYPWQKKLYDMICVKPHPREIYWINDPTGNVGKSEWLRTLRITDKNRIISCNGGSESNIINLINNKVEDGFDLLIKNLTFIIDIPRSKKIGDNVCVSYTLLENLKNGYCVNTKYKAKEFEFNRPHIIVLANWPPKYEEMSEDKLIEFKIINNDLIRNL